MLPKQIEFARRLTLAKLSSHASLVLKRRILERRSFVAKLAMPSKASLPLASTPPLPLFSPRQGAAVLGNGTLRLTFLNRTRDFSFPIAWHLSELAAGGRLWKMNLHYMEFLETLDNEMFLAVCEDWTRQNPPFLPDYWLDCWNSYALSIRAVVWMQQLALRAGSLQKNRTDTLCTSLAQQLRFLERNIESDIGGNHVIKNIKALIWASAFFEGADAWRWRQKGLTLLSKELSRQILPCGTHFERSASYHAQVFADLLECRHALGGEALSGALDSALHRMAQVTADLAHPDGGPVLFNDAGLGMAYSPGACLDIYERIFGRRPHPRHVFALDAAGYYGIRAGDMYFVADCGEIAPGDLPAHGHGDVLSFELSAGGQRVIVDQGVLEYNAGERRQRARSAASHNTLCFEGADQADFYGAFRCGRRPDVTVLQYEAFRDSFILEGTHTGFEPLLGRPRHIRRFHAGPERIVIHDRIEGTCCGAARIGFLLHPAAEVSAAGGTATLRRGAAILKLTAGQPIEIEPAVWWPDMGVEEKTSRLVLRLSPPALAARTEIQVSSSKGGVPDA